MAMWKKMITQPSVPLSSTEQRLSTHCFGFLVHPHQRHFQTQQAPAINEEALKAKYTTRPASNSRQTQ